MDKAGKNETGSAQEFDVVVIGGGPSRITAAIRCMTHHLSVLLVARAYNYIKSPYWL